MSQNSALVPKKWPRRSAVAPVRGVYRGHAGQRLSVDVRVRPALDDEGREQLNEDTAAPSESQEVSSRPQQQSQQQQ